MPRIEKPKSKVKKTTARKITPLTLPTPKTSKHSPKSSPTAYFNCLLTYANQNWHHPVTGQKQKITACCRDCKLNAPALNSEKDKELVKLITSYKQVGDSHKQIGASLAKLLKPIK